MILWLLTMAVAWTMGGLARRPLVGGPARARDVTSKAVGLALCVLGVALVSVGIASGTIRPHVIQMLPAAVALAMCLIAEPLGMAAVMAICSFWLVTMAAIWLFLLGWMSFLTGTFSTVEITLTFIIGAASLVGVLASQRLQRMSSRSTFLTIVVSSAVQAGALWISYQPIIVGR